MPGCFMSCEWCGCELFVVYVKGVDPNSLSIVCDDCLARGKPDD